MLLLEEKWKLYEELMTGKEIPLEEVPVIFEDCLVYNGSAVIEKNTFLLINTENMNLDFNSIIFGNNHLPISTMKTTSQIITEHREQLNMSYRINKDIIKRLYQRMKLVRFPEIDFNWLFVPLSGNIQKNSDYINLNTLNNLRKFDQSNSVIAFKNALEFILPYKFKCL